MENLPQLLHDKTYNEDLLEAAVNRLRLTNDLKSHAVADQLAQFRQNTIHALEMLEIALNVKKDRAEVSLYITCAIQKILML